MATLCQVCCALASRGKTQTSTSAVSDPARLRKRRMLVAIDRTIRWCQVGFVPATMQNGAISGDSQIADMLAGRILGSFSRDRLVNACELPDGSALGCFGTGQKLAVILIGNPPRRCAGRVARKRRRVCCCATAKYRCGDKAETGDAKKRKGSNAECSHDGNRKIKFDESTEELPYRQNLISSIKLCKRR